MKKSAILQMFIAASLWGFGFIATVWTLRSLGPLWLTVLRFLIACLVSLPLILLLPKHRQQLNWANLKLAFFPGLFMIATLIFQTWGLQYTTATKSSFITCLYVLLVPILDMLILKRRLSSFHPIFVASALVGTALICDFQAGQWNLGDFLTLLCALAATLQIFWLGLIAKRLPSSLVFNFMQSLWSLVMPLGLALTLEKWPGFPMTGLPLLGLLALSFGSTLGAFGLQVSAQRHLSPSVASLLCLLESPFATIYAFYFLGEHLSRTQWLGAGLILLSVIAATLLDIHLEAKTNVST